MRVEPLRTLPCSVSSCCGAARRWSRVTTRPGQRVEAATVPSRFTDTELVADLASATAMALAPDGRIFVCEQAGKLRIIKNGTLLSEPFLSVRRTRAASAACSAWPSIRTSRASPSCTSTTRPRRPPSHNRVSRFTANGDVAVAGSEAHPARSRTAEQRHQPQRRRPPLRSRRQALRRRRRERQPRQRADARPTLLGKMLRLNTDGTIPTDNPFYTRSHGQQPRHLGARACATRSRFAVQPGTGRMFINDVGREHLGGDQRRRRRAPTTAGRTPRARRPTRAFARRCSPTARLGSSQRLRHHRRRLLQPAHRAVSRRLRGRLLLRRLLRGWIRKFDPRTGTRHDVRHGIASPVDLKVAADGSLYYLARGGGDRAPHRATRRQPGAARITTQPASQTVRPGQSATFSVGASGTPPLQLPVAAQRRQHRGRDGSQLHDRAGGGGGQRRARFRVRRHQRLRPATSNEATLTVPTNQRAHRHHHRARGGHALQRRQTITFAGTGTDPEDGTLPASAFTWRVDFHHDTHIHPFMPDHDAASRAARSPIPTTGETSANVWYRIYLTGDGLAAGPRTSVPGRLPRTVKLRLEHRARGAAGDARRPAPVTPLEVEGVVGVVRTLGVVSPQVKDGTTYVFDHWSDGGGVTHEVPTPSADARFTAVFRARRPTPGDGLRAEYFDALDFTQLKWSVWTPP